MGSVRKRLAAGRGALCLSITALAAFECPAQSAYSQQNLVSDLAGVAGHTDTNLVNPWGIAFGATTPFWITDNRTGRATVYDSSGTPQTAVVSVPPASGGTSPSAPSGIVFNTTASFPVTPGTPARFIFSTENGVIAAWSSGTTALRKVDNSASSARYKGLAIGSDAGTDYLYATDFHGGKVDVFDANFGPALSGSFVDPNQPAGYAPFGIQNIGGQIYVSFALQNASGEEAVPGAGHGFVDLFTVRGVLVRRFATQGVLNSPWGLVQAPPGFGVFSGTLLIGNFGDGRINAFDPATGTWLGALLDANHSPLVLNGLWGLTFGNGSSAGDSHTLYFTAGIPGTGALEDHGLFGSLSLVHPKFTSISNSVAGISLTWTGGSGSFQLQFKTNLADSGWANLLTTTNHGATVPATVPNGLFRLLSN